MTTRRAGAEGTRERLLNAALTTLQQRGVVGLTLEEVARSAGVSKGGLLHHFPSKDALIAALVQQIFDEFSARVESYLHGAPERPGRLLRAYVRATFDEPLPPLELAGLLLPAVSSHPGLLALVQADVLSWRRRLLDDGLSPARATVIRHAADAHWTERVLGVEPDDRASHERIRDELLQLIEEALR